MTLATDQNLQGYGLSATSKAMLAIRDQVFEYWQREVRANIKGAGDLPEPVLVNTLPTFYDNLAEAVTASYPREHATSNNTASGAHGDERARMTHFRVDQVIQEYHLLREAIWVVANQACVVFNDAEWQVVERSIDLAVRVAVKEFAATRATQRERLAASLSHDMRTPLGLVVTGAQLVSLSSTLEMAQRAALKIQAGARRLEDMLIELTDTFAFEGGARLPLTITRFDMHDLLTEIGNEFHGQGHDSVEVSGSSIVGHWCEKSMRRAVENLLTNAFKYGDGAIVRIHAEQMRGRLLLSVHNRGNPIASELRERVFDYLLRDANGAQVEGWGIGLPFVKSVAQCHGGSVAVDSSGAAGTTFLIDVPLDCRPFVALAGSWD
ncbi:sensor histidine kinase [Duganella levis]|uniref:histidine kinase n=1 Tax=Duganella levis TaxID=2692169 RepID=A0ABW9VT68_9BURK|nr:HAMP domain-containing sensor histidine kinase [Duganella levis]MYN24821.1 sensor histidine kinase [Duganella levis]